MKLLFKLFVLPIAAPVVAAAFLAWIFHWPRRRDLGGN